MELLRATGHELCMQLLRIVREWILRGAMLYVNAHQKDRWLDVSQ